VKDAQESCSRERKQAQAPDANHGSSSQSTGGWVFVQMSDQKELGEVRLAIMRADSGRRYFFRPVAVRHNDFVQATVFCIRLYDCVFPDRGIYFVELWYDDAWMID
jgi:hypothetical protein